MRRIVALGLACMLAACSGGAQSASEDVVTFQFFGDAEEVRAYRSLIAAFEREHPDVRIRMTAVPKQSDHMAKLATAFGAGAAPDLFLVNYRRFGQFAAKGVLEPLGPRLDASPRLAREAFFDEPLDAFTFDGTLTCLPQNISSLVVYWNSALFADAGVRPPQPDWTWDQFLEAAKRLTRDTDGDGKVDVYGVGTEPTLVRFAPFVWQAGGEVVDATADPEELRLAEPAAVKAAHFFISLRRVHGVSPQLEEAESEDYESRFQAGRLAMLLDSRRATPSLREVPGLDWDVAPLPRGERAASILHSDAYCMTASSPRKDAAFRFVEFALGEEGASIIARSGRTVPSIRSVARSKAFLDPTQRPASAHVFLDTIPSMRRLPNIATWHEIETRADPVVEEWYYGTEPPELLGLEIIAATHGLFDRGT